MEKDPGLTSESESDENRNVTRINKVNCPTIYCDCCTFDLDSFVENDSLKDITNDNLDINDTFEKMSEDIIVNSDIDPPEDIINCDVNDTSEQMSEDSEEYILEGIEVVEMDSSDEEYVLQKKTVEDILAEETSSDNFEGFTASEGEEACTIVNNDGRKKKRVSFNPVTRTGYFEPHETTVVEEDSSNLTLEEYDEEVNEVICDSDEENSTEITRTTMKRFSGGVTEEMPNPKESSSKGCVDQINNEITKKAARRVRTVQLKPKQSSKAARKENDPTAGTELSSHERRNGNDELVVYDNGETDTVCNFLQSSDWEAFMSGKDDLPRIIENSVVTLRNDSETVNPMSDSITEVAEVCVTTSSDSNESNKAEHDSNLVKNSKSNVHIIGDNNSSNVKCYLPKNNQRLNSNSVQTLKKSDEESGTIQPISKQTEPQSNKPLKDLIPKVKKSVAKNVVVVRSNSLLKKNTHVCKMPKTNVTNTKRNLLETFTPQQLLLQGKYLTPVPKSTNGCKILKIVPLPGTNVVYNTKPPQITTQDVKLPQNKIQDVKMQQNNIQSVKMPQNNIQSVKKPQNNIQDVKMPQNSEHMSLNTKQQLNVKQNSDVKTVSPQPRPLQMQSMCNSTKQNEIQDSRKLKYIKVDGKGVSVTKVSCSEGKNPVSTTKVIARDEEESVNRIQDIPVVHSRVKETGSSVEDSVNRTASTDLICNKKLSTSESTTQLESLNVPLTSKVFDHNLAILSKIFSGIGVNTSGDMLDKRRVGNATKRKLDDIISGPIKVARIGTEIQDEATSSSSLFNSNDEVSESSEDDSESLDLNQVKRLDSNASFEEKLREVPKSLLANEFKIMGSTIEEIVNLPRSLLKMYSPRVKNTNKVIETIDIADSDPEDSEEDSSERKQRLVDTGVQTQIREIMLTDSVNSNLEDFSDKSVQTENSETTEDQFIIRLTHELRLISDDFKSIVKKELLDVLKKYKDLSKK